MKKVISLLLCTLLLLPLLMSTAFAQAEDGPYTPYADTLRMTTVKMNNPNPQMPEGMTMSDNPFFTALKEKLNIELEVTNFYDNYSQQLAMDIITGNVSDIINITDYLTYQELVANDLIQPLNGLIEQYGSEYMKQTYASYGEDYFDATTVDGNIMAIPGNSGGYMQNLLWIRKDWLDDLNLDPPKTLEELIYVAQQFMQHDPGGNGPGGTIGINSRGADSFQGPANQHGLETIAYLFGAYPGSWVTGSDGQAVYGSVQPEMKAALSQIKSMYDTGVLDVAVFEQSWEDVWANVQEGRCGIWFCNWSFAYNHIAFNQNLPDAELICYEAPLNANGEFTYVDSSNVRSWYAVRKGFEHPEALIKIMNVCFDMWLGMDEEGFAATTSIREKGTNWTSAIPTGDFNIVQYDIIPVLGDATRNFIDNGIMDETLLPSDQFMVQQAARWANGESDLDADWIVYTSRYVASPETKTGIENIIKPAFTFSTDLMVDKWTSLLAMEREMYRLILKGEQPLDYFDEFVTQWNDNGGREITQEVRDAIANMG